MIHARLDTWRHYLNSPAWDEVYAFLAALPADHPPEQNLQVGSRGAFAHVMEYETRDPEAAILEAHDRYIDVQMSLRGAERIDIFERTPLAVQTPYDAVRDATFFVRPGDARIRVDNVPGMFTLLGPDDAHMAQLDPIEGRNLVLKVVVKVPLDATGEKR